MRQVRPAEHEAGDKPREHTEPVSEDVDVAGAVANAQVGEEGESGSERETDVAPTPRDGGRVFGGP